MTQFTHNFDFPLPGDVLPHTYPRLWLDGVTALVPGESAQGFWTPSDENYEGHFDGRPLLQGVQQVESIAQLGGFVVKIGSEVPVLGILTGIEKTTFEQTVRPGDTLELSFEVTDRVKRNFTGQGSARVNGKIACRTTITGLLISEKAANMLLRRPSA